MTAIWFIKNNNDPLQIKNWKKNCSVRAIKDIPPPP